ncbi:hypothetical protein B0T24DRAFT_591507 [Lasiosphaeria ovina]|uniref:Uncharacterized protein n=1 Tax=Lasiosphaeria ovina TaxID=92902 RepID=A0AAE0N9K4_9PEZI|nr:hypothetical protein B0T24DRAFT_591507 [Lasiosphaeria ovina]
MAAKDIIQGIADMEEMESSRFAKHGLRMLKGYAKRWGIEVPKNKETGMPDDVDDGAANNAGPDSDFDPLSPSGDFKLAFMHMWDQASNIVPGNAPPSVWMATYINSAVLYPWVRNSSSLLPIKEALEAAGLALL